MERRHNILFFRLDLHWEGRNGWNGPNRINRAVGHLQTTTGLVRITDPDGPVMNLNRTREPRPVAIHGFDHPLVALPVSQFEYPDSLVEVADIRLAPLVQDN